MQSINEENLRGRHQLRSLQRVQSVPVTSEMYILFYTFSLGQMFDRIFFLYIYLNFSDTVRSDLSPDKPRSKDSDKNRQQRQGHSLE